MTRLRWSRDFGSIRLSTCFEVAPQCWPIAESDAFAYFAPGSRSRWSRMSVVSPSHRDEFPASVKRQLAERVGYVCSNPRCRKHTIGPASGNDGSVGVGMAAHITAAADGGPRYDRTISRDERRGINNGIWCCRNCGTLVDEDHDAYTEDDLKSWKREAESRAAEQIAAVGVGPAVVELEKVLSGHTNYVWDVVVTPDSRRAVSASNDGTLRVWDLVSGLKLHTLEGHTSWVCSAAVSSDGTKVAAGAADGAVLIWRLGSGELTARLPEHADDAKVAWLSDDRLAVGDSSGMVRIWRNMEGVWTVDRAHHPHAEPILKVLTLRGGEIGTASADNTAKIWDVESGEVRLVLDGHSGDVNSVAVDQASTFAVTGSTDHSLAIWNLQDGACTSRLAGHRDTVWRVAVAPGDKMIASGSGDNTVRLWSSESGACLKELPHDECVAAIAFSPDGRQLIVGCDDNRVHIYRVLPEAS